MQREVQRVKDLEIRDEQNQKVLKRKTEELASAKRRLRSASGVLPPITRFKKLLANFLHLMKCLQIISQNL